MAKNAYSPAADKSIGPARIYHFNAETGAICGAFGEGVISLAFSLRQMDAGVPEDGEEASTPLPKIAICSVFVQKAPKDGKPRGNAYPRWVLTGPRALKDGGVQGGLTLHERVPPGAVALGKKIGRLTPTLAVAVSRVLGVYAAACEKYLQTVQARAA